MSRERDRRGRRILPFHRPASSPRRDDERPPGESGRILLFTGVRYQRVTETVAPPVIVPDAESGGDLRIGG